MRKGKNYLQVLTFFVAFNFLLSTVVMAPITMAAEAPAPSPDKTASTGEPASKEELAQILAPIALYPDTLLAQMFMAATYPLEIVEAARFVKEKSSLKDDALDKALKEKEWDVSVKSLCHFPTVLATLSEHLEATKRLGDYFLNDQKAVMDMVQTLRTKAREEGKLETTKEQKVTEEEKIIVIESTNPEVVYVPSYSSTYVYGSWWYPHYPPYGWYPHYPGYGFGVGIAIGIGIGAWCSPNWGRGDIDINIDRTNNFNKNVDRDRQGKGGKGDRQSWKHDSKHRQGVSYKDKKTREKFGQSDRAAKKKNFDRGRTSQGLDKKSRDSIKKQGLKTNNRKTSSQRSKRQGSSAFKSSGSGQRASKMSQRGSGSRSFNQSGGRSRGGGGGRGGGGRR